MGAKDETGDQIELLRAEVAALRENVTSLMNDLRVARSHIDLTMRGQMRCRACNCRRIAHAPKVLDSSESGMRRSMALYQPSIWSGKTKGQLEVYACTRCGLAEWWVSDPATLEAHEEYLFIIDGDVSGPKDPYR
ncbi:MAG: hypothetical protein M4D80_20925 [Myxococcota bacterium]|nr:hypothetical protein [Myxococcota bacterium]